jgi:hypothetical protein
VEQIVEPGAVGLSWARRQPRGPRVPRAGALPSLLEEEEEEAPGVDGARMEESEEPRVDQPEARVQEERVEQPAPEAQAEQVPEPVDQAQLVPDEEALQEGLRVLQGLQEPEEAQEAQSPQVTEPQVPPVVEAQAQQVPEQQAQHVPEEQAQQEPEPQAQGVPGAGPEAQAAERRQAQPKEPARKAGVKRKLPTPSTSSPPQPVRKSSRLAGERELVMAGWVKGKPVARPYTVRTAEELTPPRPKTHVPGPRGGSIPLKDTGMQPPTLVQQRPEGRASKIAALARIAAAAAEAAPSAGPGGLTLIDEPEVQVPARAGGHARAAARAGPAPGSEDSSSSVSSGEEEAGGPEGVDEEGAGAPADVPQATAGTPTNQFRDSRPIDRKTTRFTVYYHTLSTARFKRTHRIIQRSDTVQESHELVYFKSYGKVCQDDLPEDTSTRSYTADDMPIELWDEYFNGVQEHPVFEREREAEALPSAAGAATDEAAQQPSSTQPQPAASSSQPSPRVRGKPQVQTGGEKGWEVQVVRTMRGDGSVEIYRNIIRRSDGKSVRTSLAVIVGAARVSGPGYDGPFGVKLIDGPLPDPLWQEFRAGVAGMEAAEWAATETGEDQPQFEVLSSVTSAGATGAEAEAREGEQVVDQQVPRPVEPEQVAEGETQAAAGVQTEALPLSQAEPQVEAQPQPQVVDTVAGQPAGTVEPVAGPDNWTWRVQAGADPLARGPYTVYRYITRKADGLRSMFCLMVKDHGQVVMGSEYEGDFEPHYYLGELPDELKDEFEQNRIDKFSLVPSTQPTPAVATGAAAGVVEVDAQGAQRQPLAQKKLPREPWQEPEAEVEAEVLPEVGGPTAPGPQPLGVPSQVPESVTQEPAELQEPEVQPEAPQEPTELAGPIVPVAGGQTTTLPQPQELPGPAQGARMLPTGRTSPVNWQYKVEVKEKKTGRMAKDVYRSITRWVDGVEAKILLSKRKGTTYLEGRTYHGTYGPWYYTEDMPPWLLAEFNAAHAHHETTGQEYFPEPTPVLPVTRRTDDRAVYAGVHSKGLQGPWKHTDGYLVWVAMEFEDNHPITVKWIQEFPSKFIMGMKLNMYFGGAVGSGREFLGLLGMHWYPRGRVPWQIEEAFLGCRTREAMASPEVRIDMPHYEIQLMMLPSHSPVRINGLRWVDVVYSYPDGDVPDWDIPTPIGVPPVVGAAGPRAHPVEVSDDDEVEFIREVDAPIRGDTAHLKQEKRPSAEVTLERPLERVSATSGEGAIPSLPGADTQPEEVSGVQEGTQRVESAPEAPPPEPTLPGVSIPMVPPPIPLGAGEVVQGGVPASTSPPGPSVSQVRQPVPLFSGLPGLPVLRSIEPDVKPESPGAGPAPQGSFVSGSVGGTTGVSGSSFSFSTQGESSGTRRSGRSERSGESRRSRKGKERMQQLEARLKEQDARLEKEKQKNRKMLALIIMRSEGKTLEEAYAELDRQEAEMEQFEAANE